MKMIVKSIKPLLLLLSVLLTACDCSTEILPFTESGGESVRTVAYLKSLCDGTGYTVTDDIVVEGVVTGNDLYGEFYKTLVIEDASGGISVEIEAARLADDFPMGCPVSLYCQGLRLGDYGGKIEIGAVPAAGEEYAVGRIARADLPKYLRRRTMADARQPQPDTIAFDEAGAYYMDRYVCFSGVRFADAGAANGVWCEVDSLSKPIATERMLINATGETFAVRTAATCTYAGDPLPQGTGCVAGILDYFNGKYTLRISDRRFAFPD